MKIVLWDWDGDLTEICAFDEKKNEVPVQVIKDPENYWAHKYFTLLMEVEVPAFGYATYVISQKEKAQLDIDWEMFSTTGGMDPRIDEYNDGPIVLENSKVKAVFDPMTMLLTSFTDKATGKEPVSYTHLLSCQNALRRRRCQIHRPTYHDPRLRGYRKCRSTGIAGRRCCRTG